jgi:hypothetical protein
VTRVLTKIVVSSPHAQVGQPYFQQRHDVIRCVIEFVHLSRLRLQILLSPEHLPQFLAIALTCGQDAKAPHRMLFQLDFALAHLPVCRELPCFSRKVVPLLCLVRGFQWQDLQRELHPLVFIGLSLLLEVLVLVSEVGQACSAGLGQVFQVVNSPLQHHLTFSQLRVDDLLFRVPMIRV